MIPFPGVAILVTLLLLILVLFLFVKMMEERRKRKMMPILSSEFDASRYDPKLPWIEQLEALAYDEGVWEFPRHRLMLGEVLGQGAFGVVRKGVAKGLGSGGGGGGVGGGPVSGGKIASGCGEGTRSGGGPE